MAARVEGQLMLILERNDRFSPVTQTPEGLVQALADLLLEAFEGVARQSEESGHDDLQDHV